MVYFILNLEKTKPGSDSVLLCAQNMSRPYVFDISKASTHRIGPHPDNKSFMAVKVDELHKHKQEVTLEDGSKEYRIPNTVAFWAAMNRPEMVLRITKNNNQ